MTRQGDLDVAAREKVEVLILGKCGCGAFHNPLDVVARVFKKLLKDYRFGIVEFALATSDDVSNDPFARIIQCDGGVNPS